MSQRITCKGCYRDLPAASFRVTRRYKTASGELIVYRRRLCHECQSLKDSADNERRPELRRARNQRYRAKHKNSWAYQRRWLLARRLAQVSKG